MTKNEKKKKIQKLQDEAWIIHQEAQELNIQYKEKLAILEGYTNQISNIQALETEDD